MAIRPLVLAVLTFSSAAAADPLPRHIVWNIQHMVRYAEAVAIVTVDAAKPERVVLDLARQVVGQQPQEVEIPSAGFDERDLVPGTQLLVALRHAPDGSWVSAGRYELVAEGKVREYPLEQWLAQTTEQSALRGRRALRELPRARVAPKVVSQAAPAPAVAPVEEAKAPCAGQGCT